MLWTLFVWFVQRNQMNKLKHSIEMSKTVFQIETEQTELDQFFFSTQPCQAFLWKRICGTSRKSCTFELFETILEIATTSATFWMLFSPFPLCPLFLFRFCVRFGSVLFVSDFKYHTHFECEFLTNKITCFPNENEEKIWNENKKKLLTQALKVNCRPYSERDQC